MGNKVVAGLCVSVILKNDKDQIFLLKRSNSAYENNKWTLPGGHVEHGETIEEGAIRETEEEAGVQINSMSFSGVAHTKNSDESWIHFVFCAEQYAGEPYINEPNKFSDCGWFDLDNLPEECTIFILAYNELFGLDNVTEIKSVTYRK